MSSQQKQAGIPRFGEPRHAAARSVRGFRHVQLHLGCTLGTVPSTLGIVEEGGRMITPPECSRSLWRLRRPLTCRRLVAAIAALPLLAGCGGSSSSTPTSHSAAAAPVAPPTGSWTASEPVGAATYSTLAWVQCNGSTNCYADGFDQGGAVSSDFLQHWDGHSWTSSVGTVGSGAPPGAGELDCLPSGFCVVPLLVNTVSIYSVMGGRWTAMAADDPRSPKRPDASVNAVACFSETRCLAVGAVGSSAATSPLGLSWNGNRWKSTVLAPQGTDPVQTLASVSCGSSSFC